MAVTEHISCQVSGRILLTYSDIFCSFHLHSRVRIFTLLTGQVQKVPGGTSPYLTRKIRYIPLRRTKLFRETIQRNEHGQAIEVTFALIRVTC